MSQSPQLGKSFSFFFNPPLLICMTPGSRKERGQPYLVPTGKTGHWKNKWREVVARLKNWSLGSKNQKKPKIYLHFITRRSDPGRTSIPSSSAWVTWAAEGIEIKSTVKASTVLTQMKALQTTTITCCQSLQTSKTWTLEQRANIGFFECRKFL